MPEQPYYSYTDSKGDTLEIRKSPNTQPEYGAPEVRVTPSRSSGYREWWYGPRGEEAIEAARVFLDAAGLTDHVIVAPADDGTTGHRVVSEEWLTTVIKINREDAARSMCERATEEIQRAWPDLADSRTPVEQCGQVVDAVDALPLLADTTPTPDGTTLAVSDSPKMLHETLCFAQSAIGLHPDQSRASEHTKRLSRLIAECERHRPLGVDGKHGDLHTPTCGCEDVHYDPAWTPTGPENDLTLCASTFVGTTGTEHACGQPTGHTTMHHNIAGTAAWSDEADERAPHDTDLAGRAAHLEASHADETHALVIRMRGMVHAALGRIADLEEALDEATGLMEDYQTDQAAIRGRLDALQAQPKGAVHITVTGPALTEETDG